MKIAYFLPSLANKGPILVVKDIITYLVKQADIDVYYFDPIMEVSMPCPVYQINFFEKIDFGKYDVLHSHMLRPDAYLYFHRRLIKGKRISTLHNYVEADLKNSHNAITATIFTHIWGHLLNKFDKLVALSNDMELYYRNIYSNSNITYIYNGRDVNTEDIETVPSDDFARIKAFKGDSLLLGVAAGITERKGIDQILHLLACKPYLKLLVIGDGPSKKTLLQLAQKLQVEKRCLFLGYRNNGQRYYSFFDIYMMTSRSEGFALALIEAAAYGLPTLSSDLPVFKETFSSEEVSFYKLDDLQSMIRSFEHLQANLEDFAANIRKKYLQYYTANSMASNYYKLYLNLLSSEV